MKTKKQNLSRKKPGIVDTETRFLRLYSQWHETHDLSLKRRLLLRLSLIRRRMPNFDPRSTFQHSF